MTKTLIALRIIAGVEPHVYRHWRMFMGEEPEVTQKEGESNLTHRVRVEGVILERACEVVDLAIRRAGHGPPSDNPHVGRFP